MKEFLKGLVEKNRIKSEVGNVADYIPGLEKSDKNALGLCITSTNGTIYSIGDCNIKFTIQSVSKPITLMLAILDHGEEHVFSKVGMEPTGDAFNSIQKLETCKTHKPFNPMINAGAIATSALIKGKNSQEKFQRLLDFFRKISENETLEVNDDIYLGESLTGNKNKAMAYFMKGEGYIDGSIEDALYVYFRQCSIEVTAKDLARIGLFLARGGVMSNGERVVSERIAKIIKTLMITCGMYDGSGEFALRVGIPSKSGVGGGIMSVVPGKMGIGVFSPALDNKGNPIAGEALLEDLSSELSLSIF
ncbi:glutaminase A [Ilyobacter polytropus]|uniref:Glutaminase n=1 Tax=Ilyobacter polytropus (strain ATCC 51220 / DSM 2926 / LMG 16218 / CuHBu1) TaxID=572544 RepID=E3HDE1_ILYPC|nr:glutaminase A [Ilyobacter polytropus]ADO84141.1 L-glutaminase [Ilyobacter polytropus DSM 2926]